MAEYRKSYRVGRHTASIYWGLALLLLRGIKQSAAEHCSRLGNEAHHHRLIGWMVLDSAALLLRERRRPRNLWGRRAVAEC